MGKKIKKIKTSIPSFVKVAKLNRIIPFTEKPSEENMGRDNPDEKARLAASELFSLFTADIIKEEKLFVR